MRLLPATEAGVVGSGIFLFRATGASEDEVERDAVADGGIGGAKSRDIGDAVKCRYGTIWESGRDRRAGARARDRDRDRSDWAGESTKILPRHKC